MENEKDIASQYGEKKFIVLAQIKRMLSDLFDEFPIQSEGKYFYINHVGRVTVASERWVNYHRNSINWVVSSEDDEKLVFETVEEQEFEDVWGGTFMAKDEQIFYKRNSFVKDTILKHIMEVLVKQTIEYRHCLMMVDEPEK